MFPEALGTPPPPLAKQTKLAVMNKALGVVMYEAFAVPLPQSFPQRLTWAKAVLANPSYMLPEWLFLMMSQMDVISAFAGGDSGLVSLSDSAIDAHVTALLPLMAPLA